MPDKHPYVVNPELTGISLAYKNQRYIGDLVLPRKTVTSESFKYTIYPKAQYFTVPDTLTGPKGQANEVELKSEEKTDSVETHTLKDIVPQADIDAATENNDPLAKATIYVTDLLQLGRELRAAKTIQDAANYGIAKSLTSAEKISKLDVDAGDLIQNTIDEMMFAPNTMITNRIAMSKLRRNPFIVKAFGNTSGTGMVPIEFLKEYFDLENIFVGQAQHNVAKKGQVPTLAGCWGSHISLVYLNPIVEVNNGVTFGLTAEFESRTIKTYRDEDRGSKGAEIVRGVEQNKDLIIAPECGAILKDVV